ncbi:MAG: hypothetical protein PHX49_09945 [Bacteroidales bacterium]|jgi:hypothetical protein|nr:hypothetical protein [Bacteroidales bacterium]
MIKYWLSIWILIIFCSCHRNASVAVLSEGENQPVAIIRFDKELYSQLKDSTHIDYASLKEKHPKFWNVYVESILAISAEDSTSLVSELNDFFYNPEIQVLYSDVEAEYDSIEPIRADLQEAFYTLSKYYPEVKRPLFYTHLSGLNQSVVVSDDVISVSLDKYLGVDYTLYNNTVYSYEKTHMNRENIVRDYLAGWFYSEFPFNGVQDRVLDNMIYQGKLYFLYSLLFRHADNRTIMDYSEKEMDVALKNEKKIWTVLRAENKLYDTDQLYSSRLINDAPFTMFGVGNVPGRVGCWIGLKIINSYVKQHPDIHLKDLLLESNYHRILEESNYPGYAD